jgi:hypothetical protein
MRWWGKNRFTDELRFYLLPIHLDSQISKIDFLNCYMCLTSQYYLKLWTHRVLLITISREKGINAVLGWCCISDACNREFSSLSKLFALEWSSTHDYLKMHIVWSIHIKHSLVWPTWTWTVGNKSDVQHYIRSVHLFLKCSCLVNCCCLFC